MRSFGSFDPDMALSATRDRCGESVQTGNTLALPSTALAREVIYTRIGIAFASLFGLWWLSKIGLISLRWIQAGNIRTAMEDALLIPVLMFFFFGQLVYLFCRLGFLRRTQSHRPAPRAEIESIYDCERPPPLTVLIPSYCERSEVVRRTILSAALLEYPDRRVVLLIDDPPVPASAKAAGELAAMRQLAGEIEAMFRPQERKFCLQLSYFEGRAGSGPIDQVRERSLLESLYQEAAVWLESLAASFDGIGHTDQLFVTDILLKPAKAAHARANEIKQGPAEKGRELSRHEIAREYKRLATLFAVRVSCFERKRFVNLSHAMSKAMNLNSYIGLIARNFRIVIGPDGSHLEECEAAHAQIRIPDAKYIIALDADTLLVHDYALRLIHLMEQDGNRRVAIAQSPHRSIPGSPIVLERAAGAQTDLQRMLCQGSAHYGAAYWVGGSALIRRDALEDICEHTLERGYPLRKYIQDRTLVEDTESSLGFLAHGWSIYNYLDPLTYSEIPGDYGALIVQRRRWSSGGLLNIPTLGQYLRSAHQRWRKIPEALLRFHYLASTTVNLGMLLLPLAVTHDNTPIGWFPLTALVYYTFYTRDLFLCGYSWTDLPRVYALNLLLIPVSINGVVNSIRQWWTGRKPTFQRTPKIRERTAIPVSYVLVTWLIAPATLTIAILDMISGGISVAVLGILNAVLLGTAVVQFIGLRESWEDLHATLSRKEGKSSLQQAIDSAAPMKESSGIRIVSPLRLASTSFICAIILASAVYFHAEFGSIKADGSLEGTRVAITIDDISDHGDLLPTMSREDMARAFVKILKDNGIDNAFGFTNGKFLPNNQQELMIFRIWLNAGYPLGNHTYDHPDLNQIGAEAFIANIAKQERLLATLSDYSPLLKKRFMFRYPFLDEGDTLKKRNAVRRYLATNGYRIAEVTTDYHDWAWSAAYTRCLNQHNRQSVAWLKTHVVESADEHLRESNAISKRLFNRRIPQILLVHDNSFDLLTLDAILNRWRAQGIVFISLEEALADPIYQINPNLAYKVGGDFLAQISAARHVRLSDIKQQTYTVAQLNKVCKGRDQAR